MKKLLYLLILLFPLSLCAQETNCNCEQVLSKLIQKVETEYPGFSAKTNATSLYKGFKEDLIKQAKQRDALVCQQLLKQYTDFFKDPHLWVGANGAPFSSATTARVNSVAIDLQQFQNQVKKTKDTLEGVWSTDGYRIGITKLSKGEYVGFIIEAESSQWKPKEIKFRLFSNGTFEYALRDKSLKMGNYTLYKEGVLYLNEVSVALVKQNLQATVSKEAQANRLNELEGFYFKQLTPKTAMLKLPSFEYQYLKQISQLIDDHQTALENTENLIIDLRGNPGGTTDAYQKLLPYIMGKTIRNTGAEFLATQTYINNLEAYKKTLDKNTPITQNDKQIATLQANLGQFVNFNAKGEPVYLEQVTVAAKSPKHIVILANKGSGSSAEYFLFVAKQSKKVKILGIPSYGALDYGNAYLVDFGCPGYQVFMPTYRALRLPDYPIDNVGIQPDVYMDKSIKDWVAFAVSYLEE